MRTKANEMYALKELLPILIKNKEKITPILEPSSTNSTTLDIITKLNDCDIPLILITNPKVGKLPIQEAQIKNEIIDPLKNNTSIILGYFIDETTKIEDINTFMSTYPTYKFALIHQTTSPTKDKLISFIKNEKNIKYNIFLKNNDRDYIESFQEFNRVLITDPFNKSQRNADYPSEEFYSAIFSNYKSKYYGFGDYQIVGDHFSERGGPAHAVALHLTYLKSNNTICIKHFVSDDTEGIGSVQLKYLQALKKLMDFVKHNKLIYDTLGIEDYRKNYVSNDYHGLGFPKKFSIKHHIELILNLI